MKETRAFDCIRVVLPKVLGELGSLTSINSTIDVPFFVKRVYYLYDVPGGESRGAHAHRNLHQLIVAVSGSFDVIIDDGSLKKVFSLSSPFEGLYVPPGLWRDLTNFNSGSICLVLASEKYTEDDYIRNYYEFIKHKN